MQFFVHHGPTSKQFGNRQRRLYLKRYQGSGGGGSPNRDTCDARQVLQTRKMIPGLSQFQKDHDAPVVPWAPIDLVLAFRTTTNDDENGESTTSSSTQQSAAAGRFSSHPRNPKRATKKNAQAAVHYHAVSAGYQVLAPVGALVGGIVHGTGLWRPFPSAAATMGASGVVFGSVGALLGLQKQRRLASSSAVSSSAALESLPWNDAGIERRADALSRNFVVRVLDLSALCGASAAAGIVCAKGGPAALGLSTGAVGVLQAFGIGTAAGGMSALGCIYVNRHHDP